MSDPYEGIERLSRSKSCAAKTIYAMFEILKEAGGSLPVNDIMTAIPERVRLTEWERQRLDKSGYIRWRNILHFYSIDCSKAGFLRKKQGVWYLTEEGEQAMAGGAVPLLEKASRGYKQWAQAKESSLDDMEDAVIDEEQAQAATIEQLEELAITGIKEYLQSKNPYEFQDMVAALLRAMGYHTPFVSPRGKDGGVDIIAYRDPLGAVPPRIKVQVKHRPGASIAVGEIRSLQGLLNHNGEIGLFVTSGRFTAEAEKEARAFHAHLKLIDGDTFIELWKEFYPRMNDEDKLLLPLQTVVFLGTGE